MKLRSTILACAAALLLPTVTKANVTYMTYRDGGEGTLVCPVYTYYGTDTLDITGQYRQMGAGSVVTTIWTDTPTDPTITTLAAIDNDSGFAWSGYVIDVFLSQNFTLSFPAPAVTSPPGWSASVTIAPYSTG